MDTLIFDFDNTVSLGDGPAVAYALAVEELSEGKVSKGAIVEPFLANIDKPNYEGIEITDSYHLVRVLAEAQGVNADTIQAAYFRSREKLATEDAPIHAPKNLAEMLREIRDVHGGNVRIALVTNAPDTRLTEALEALGLSGLFDEVHASARKPAGMGELAQGWLNEGRVLSVGDIWVNDLEPVHNLGGDTALIASRIGDTTPTFFYEDITRLYPDLQAWLVNEPSLTNQNPIH